MNLKGLGEGGKGSGREGRVGTLHRPGQERPGGRPCAGGKGRKLWVLAHGLSGPDARREGEPRTSPGAWLCSGRRAAGASPATTIAASSVRHGEACGLPSLRWWEGGD